MSSVWLILSKSDGLHFQFSKLPCFLSMIAHQYIYLVIYFILVKHFKIYRFMLTLNAFEDVIQPLAVEMSHVVRKPAFCIYENKDADQLRGNRQADQCLCFCYIDSTIPLLPKSEISSFLPSSVTVQPGLCGTWSETPKTGFLTTRLICTCMITCLLHAFQQHINLTLLQRLIGFSWDSTISAVRAQYHYLLVCT